MVKLQPLANDESQLAALNQMRAVCRKEAGHDPYETGPGEYWFIVRGDDIIGFTGIHSFDPVSRKVRGAGLWITKDCRGQGHATEVMAERDRIVFEEKNINRFELCVAKDNEASIAMVRKAGFVEEGTSREFLYYGGAMHEYIQFSMLRSDWDALSKGKALEAV